LFHNVEKMKINLRNVFFPTQIAVAEENDHSSSYTSIVSKYDAIWQENWPLQL
jgi:hypothetical protein